MVITDMRIGKMGYIDFHSHILPGMDDGAKDADTARKMLALLHGQQVSLVASTSHYIPHKESVEEFIGRRSAAISLMQDACADIAIPEIRYGAEIYLEKGVSGRDLRPLFLGGTNALLLELPRAPFESWMIHEIENIMYSFSAVPIMAHIERYADWYSKTEMNEVLSIEDTIFQISVSVFGDNRQLKNAKELDKMGLPLLFGSDAHNLAGRAPNWNVMTEKLKKKPKLAYLLENAERTAAELLSKNEQ